MSLPINTCNGFVQALGASHIDRNPGVLNIRLCGKLSTSTEGVYTCRLMNSSMMYQSVSVGVYFSGRSESLHNRLFNLYLYSPAPPVITRYSLSTMNVVIGSPLTLTCTSSGSPPDTFIWMKDGVPVSHSTSITAVNYTNTTAVFSTNYTISNFSTSDIGTYTCTVSNPIGNDSKTIIGKYVCNLVLLLMNPSCIKRIFIILFTSVLYLCCVEQQHIKNYNMFVVNGF